MFWEHIDESLSIIRELEPQLGHRSERNQIPLIEQECVMYILYVKPPFLLLHWMLQGDRHQDTDAHENNLQHVLDYEKDYAICWPGLKIPEYFSGRLPWLCSVGNPSRVLRTYDACQTCFPKTLTPSATSLPSLRRSLGLFLTYGRYGQQGPPRSIDVHMNDQSHILQ